jgi:hypothetical protein
MKNLITNVVFFCCLALSATQVLAADLTQQDPIQIEIKIGTKDGLHRFTPDALTLETGKLYKLRVENVGTQPYYFTSPGLADAVYTRKVVVRDKTGGVIAEIYGAIRRFEISIGQSVEWWIYPVRTGVFDDVISTKKLAQDGMRATITVK